MSVTSGAARRWRAVRKLSGRVPLRHKLIAAVLALVTVALAVISIAGISLLRGYLLGPVDSQFPGKGYVAGGIQYYLGHSMAQVGPPYGVSLTWVPAHGSPGQVIIPTQPSFGTGQVPGLGTGQVPGLGLTAIPGPAIPANTQWLTSHTDQPATVPAQSGGGEWRVLSYSLSFTNSSGSRVSGFAVYGQDVTSQYQTLARLRDVDLIVSAIVLFGLAIVGIAIVRTSLRPLTDIEQTAGRIASGDLSQRVPERDRRTEVGRLGRSLNTMLSQIETAFHAQEASEAAARRSEERMRRFVADASHELRTPLTAIRGYAEYYRQCGGTDNGPAPAEAAEPGRTGPTEAGANGGAPAAGGGQDVPWERGQAALAGPAVPEPALSKADLDRIMQRVEQESTRMGGLVEDMLLLARVDQQRPFERRPVDLLSLAADAVQDARMIAPGRSIDLTIGSDSAFLVLGDEARLRQVIGNLMNNALTHTPDGTPVDLRIRSGVLAGTASGSGAPPAGPTGPGVTAAGPTGPGVAAPGLAAPSLGAPAPVPGPAVVLEVVDQGPGLPPEQAERVFERFYRADQARTRERGGNGLGLAIVAAIIAAHGGTVSLHTVPGQGATFAVTLPLAPEALED